MDIRKNWAWLVGVGCTVAVAAACSVGSDSDPKGITPAGDDTASDDTTGDDTTGDDTTANPDAGEVDCKATVALEGETTACVACLQDKCLEPYGTCICDDTKYAEPVEGQSTGYSCSDYLSCVNICRADGDSDAGTVQDCIDLCKASDAAVKGGEPYNAFEGCAKTNCSADCTFQGE